jgi:hypothetical protein
MALKVIRELGQRLRHLRRLVEELSFTTVRDRLIVHLLRLMAERECLGWEVFPWRWMRTMKNWRRG